MKLNKVHFSVLLECYEEIKKLPGILDRAWVGRSARDWFGSAFRNERPPEISHTLGTTPRNRSELSSLITSFCERASEDEIARISLEILAWGKMTPRNTKLAWACRCKWLPICKEMIDGKIKNPVDAYSKFYDLHQHKDKEMRIKGLGPAYYTKLIYFLCHNGGLIMDQWTGRSVNLLDDQGAFIRMTCDQRGALSVTGWNDHTVYARYLAMVELIASEINLKIKSEKKISLSEAEALIFSVSGFSRKRPKSLTPDEHLIACRWRNYVVQQTAP